MNNIYAAALLSLLLSRSTCLAEDPKRTNIEAHHDEPPKHRTVCVAPAIIVPLVRMYPTNPRNQSLPAIGGSVTKSKSAAVIDGTRMKRR
jgi:hypothetical protein